MRDACLEYLLPQFESDLRAEIGSIPLHSLPEMLRERIDPIVEQVLRATTPGSAFRRRESLDRARHELRRVLESLEETANAREEQIHDADQ